MNRFLSIGKYFLVYMCIFSLCLGMIPFEIYAQGPEDRPGTDPFDQWLIDTEKEHTAENQINEEYHKLLPQQNPRSRISPVAVGIGECLGGYAAAIIGNLFGGYINDLAGPLLKPTLVPVYIPGLETKEVSSPGGVPALDTLGYCLMNGLIQYISDATINWIDSGFEGNPIFIDDPEGFLKDLTEATVKDTLNSFTNTLGNGILCRDFELDVKIALVSRVTRKTKFACTYEKALENLENEPFDFDVYANYTENPINNPMGAFLTVDSTYQELMQSRQDMFDYDRKWNRGYFSWQSSEDPSVTVTPGSVVAAKVEEWSGLKADRLVLADEFNEILGALINQLIAGALNELSDPDSQINL